MFCGRWAKAGVGRHGRDGSACAGTKSTRGEVAGGHLGHICTSPRRIDSRVGDKSDREQARRVRGREIGEGEEEEGEKVEGERRCFW